MSGRHRYGNRPVKSAELAAVGFAASCWAVNASIPEFEVLEGDWTAMRHTTLFNLARVTSGLDFRYTANSDNPEAVLSHAYNSY
jgi:hypothetical protein